MMWRGFILAIFMLTGCVGTNSVPMTVYVPIESDLLSVATVPRITDDVSPVHIYIEGDGHAFDAAGHPTSNPTPRGHFLRDMAARDTAPNVVYVARPCQYEMDDACRTTYWTDGRFSSRVVDSVAMVIRHVAGTRPVILIGYSGGAMVSGLVIGRNPDIDVRKWITIGGVLNHRDWTEYFGDTPLSSSLNMDELPHVPQVHYVAEHDKIVPPELTRRWVRAENIVVVPNAFHNDFGELKPDFSY